MIFRLLSTLVIIFVAISALGRAGAGTPIPAAVPSQPEPSKLAPFKERLAKAKSVVVQTDILGVEIDSPLEAAHAVFDSLCDPAHRPEEGADDAERDEGEHKVLWQLTKTDFGSVFVKTDGEERITQIAGNLRSGKEVPFNKIGQIEKAPIQTDKMAVWDVVRPNRPLIRVVARGAERKANSITIFIVKRSSR